MSSRQRQAQLRNTSLGLCLYGKSHGPAIRAGRCSACLALKRSADRTAKGCQPWRKGGPGRPPKPL